MERGVYTDWSLVGSLLGVCTEAGALFGDLRGSAYSNLNFIMGFDVYPFGISSGCCLRGWMKGAFLLENC